MVKLPIAGSSGPELATEAGSSPPGDCGFEGWVIHYQYSFSWFPHKFVNPWVCFDFSFKSANEGFKGNPDKVYVNPHTKIICINSTPKKCVILKWYDYFHGYIYIYLNWVEYFKL